MVKSLRWVAPIANRKSKIAGLPVVRVRLSPRTMRPVICAWQRKMTKRQSSYR